MSNSNLRPDHNRSRSCLRRKIHGKKPVAGRRKHRAYDREPDEQYRQGSGDKIRYGFDIKVLPWKARGYMEGYKTTNAQDTGQPEGQKQDILGYDAAFLLRVETLPGGGERGFVHRFQPEADIRFASLTGAFLMMDRWMDEDGFQTDNRELRRFLPESGLVRDTEDRQDDMGSDIQAGRVSGLRRESFLVKVFYRQGTSWQGEICWKDKRSYYQSVLELAALIDSALYPETADKQNTQTL